ncbi:hypothetical protein GCM10023196_053200 [Actinoallomurus vinaceus]|uniref:Secreted protein n=1 Tax=Actinoallomurus vinaceus TaxID=1080074 RepID=A0ABP8UED7_9ACTN
MAARGTSARALVTVAVAALGALTPVTRPAWAGPPALLQCQGTETTAYRPGLAFQPRHIEITTSGRFTSCVGGAVTSGSYGERFTIFVGCNDLLDGFHRARTFRWNTGDTSVIDGTGRSTATAGQVVTTITGPITAGRLRGRTAIEVITLPQPSALRCLTTGLTNATGATTLTIA